MPVLACSRTSLFPFTLFTAVPVAASPPPFFYREALSSLHRPRKRGSEAGRKIREKFTSLPHTHLLCEKKRERKRGKHMVSVSSPNHTLFGRGGETTPRQKKHNKSNCTLSQLPSHSFSCSPCPPLLCPWNFLASLFSSTRRSFRLTKRKQSKENTSLPNKQEE